MTIAVHFAMESYRLTCEPFSFDLVTLNECRVGRIMKNASQFWKPLRLFVSNRKDLFCDCVAFGILLLGVQKKLQIAENRDHCFSLKVKLSVNGERRSRAGFRACRIAALEKIPRPVQMALSDVCIVRTEQLLSRIEGE